MHTILLWIGDHLRIKRREPWHTVRIIICALMLGSCWGKAVTMHDRTFLLYAIGLTVVCAINCGDPPSFSEQFWRKHGFIP